MGMVATDTVATGNGAPYSILEPDWNCDRVAETVVKDRQFLAAGARAPDAVEQNRVFQFWPFSTRKWRDEAMPGDQQIVLPG